MPFEVGFEDAIEVGAQLAKAGMTPRQATAIAKRYTLSRPPIVPVFPGSRQAGSYESSTYLPLGVVTFVNAGVVVGQLQQAGQGNMRAHRLLLTRQNVGTASPGLTVTVVIFQIGTYNMAIGAAVTPVDVFFPTSIANPVIGGVPVTPGMLVTVGLAIAAAPAQNETVTIGGALFGEGV